MLHEYEQNLKMQGISLEQFMQFTGLTHDKLMEEYKETATKRVTYRLILDAIIKKEKIDATEKEVDKEVSELAKKYKMEKEQFINQFGTETVKYELKFKKVLDLLKGEEKAEKKTTAKKTTKKEEK